MGVEQLSSAIDDYISAKQEAKPEKWPTKADWLDDAAKRAKQITLVTHAPKFTHGDARGIGARVSGGEGYEYLTTSSLAEPAIDVIGNAAALDVANLLLLEAGGMRLVELVKEGDPSPLAIFSKDQEQLAVWMRGLALALDGGMAITHTLAKQAYFPVDEGKYHLLSPLFASSLCHALHQRIDQARFSEEAKGAREARRKAEFSSVVLVDFPNLAEQHFGGTKPQNVSLLNSRRYGRAYLLSTQPPIWQSRLTPPKSQDHFWRQYGYRVRNVTRDLTTFLMKVADRDNKGVIKDRRSALVAELVTRLHGYAAQLRSLPKGWSLAMDEPMPEALRYWLDPAAVTAPPTDWPDQVGLAFGRWLNQQLQSQLSHVGDAELHTWRRLLARELRLLKQDLEGWA